MVNYFIYAKDYSGSTKREPFYNENGLKTLQKFKSDVENIKKKLSRSGKPTESRIIYLHWGHECVQVDEETTVEKYKKMDGNGKSTLPERIIQWIHQNIGNGIKIELLYIITDGIIRSLSMHQCLQLNRKMHYENVVFHAFHQNLNRIDLSVAAAFLKGHCTIYRNNELIADTNISQEFNYNRIKIDNFITEKDNLKSYIRYKYINKFKQDAIALKEIQKLKALRERLFTELSKTQKRKSYLDTKNKQLFYQEFVKTDWYKNLSDPSHGVKVEIEKFISTLINYIVSEKKSYAFDALNYEMKYKNPIEKEPIVDVNFRPDQEIEFPDIILDEDRGIPVILLTKLNLLDKLIFHTTETSTAVSPASFSKFKTTMDCPLFLLNDSDVSESIGYFYTLSVYKQLLEKTTKTEPRTRKPFHGGLVLVETDEFDKYNDYILSATYFDSKKINYNIGLFYYVLWKNCENKEWMDKNVVEQFKKYVMRRISATKCPIGLSSLPLDPHENTSLLTALWYCVELSSCTFKEDPKHFMHERLRMYFGVAHCMIEILKYFNYDLDLESIEKRIDLIRHVMTLKRIQTRREKVYFLLEKIFKTVNGFLVCEIENPSNIKKLNYLKLNHKKTMCDKVIEEKVDLNEYVHLLHYVDGSKDNVKVCEKTFRPFFTIDQKKSFYVELVKITKKVVISNNQDPDKINITCDAIDSLEIKRIVSLYNLFIKCVKDLGKYPTFVEYIEFICRKKKFNGDLVTIFAPNVYTSAEDVYSRYHNVMKEVDVNSFIELCDKYAKRSERIKVEEVLKFENDDEIDEFISREESKVNLKNNRKSSNCSIV